MIAIRHQLIKLKSYNKIYKFHKDGLMNMSIAKMNVKYIYGRDPIKTKVSFKNLTIQYHRTVIKIIKKRYILSKK